MEDFKITHKSQKKRILEFMQQGGKINKLRAFTLFNCMTLAQRIDEIEDEITAGAIKGWKLCKAPNKLYHNAVEYWLEPIIEAEPEFNFNQAPEMSVAAGKGASLYL